jgi:hypothetical protein
VQFIWRRYARSGYAPTWLYSAFALGFVALFAWAIATADWVVAAIALLMAVAAFAGGRFMQRLRVAKEASSRDLLGAEGKPNEQ